MSTFNRKGVIAALIGAMALLSGCGSANSTSANTSTGSFGFSNGGVSAIGCVPLNSLGVTVGVQASGYLSPLITGSGVSYGINYNQVTMTSAPQGFSYRFSTVNYGDGLFLRFPDNAATQANSTRIAVSGDIGVVVIGPQTVAEIQRTFGAYGSSNLCVASIQSIWAYGTQGADIVGPKVMLMIQGPGGTRQFEMYGF